MGEVTIETLRTRAGYYRDRARELAKDGLTWGEAGGLIAAIIAELVDLANQVASMTGAQKKALVMATIEACWSLIEPAIPLPWYLGFLRPHLRPIVLAIASAVIEEVYTRLVKTD